MHRERCPLTNQRPPRTHRSFPSSTPSPSRTCPAQRGRVRVLCRPIPERCLVVLVSRLARHPKVAGLSLFSTSTAFRAFAPQLRSDMCSSPSPTIPAEGLTGGGQPIDVLPVRAIAPHRAHTLTRRGRADCHTRLLTLSPFPRIGRGAGGEGDCQHQDVIHSNPPPLKLSGQEGGRGARYRG